MLAKINVGSNLYDTLSYNQEKVDENLGKILGTNFAFEPANGQFNVTSCMNDFLQFVPAHFRTEKPVLHVSINPHPDGRLSDEQLTDASAGDLKKQISAVIKPLASMCHFQSMGKYKAVLSLYYIHLEELKGEVKGKPYRGLLYSATDKDGNKVGNPLKSSIFGKSVGYDGLEKRMEKSKERIKTKNLKQHTFTAVADAKTSCPTESEFRAKLRQQILMYSLGEMMMVVSTVLLLLTILLVLCSIVLG